MAANFVRCPRDQGESVKGGLPLSQKDDVESELAAAWAGFEKVKNVPLGFGRTGSAEIVQGCALD